LKHGDRERRHLVGASEVDSWQQEDVGVESIGDGGEALLAAT